MFVAGTCSRFSFLVGVRPFKVRPNYRGPPILDQLSLVLGVLSQLVWISVFRSKYHLEPCALNLKCEPNNVQGCCRYLLMVVFSSSDVLHMILSFSPRQNQNIQIKMKSTHTEDTPQITYTDTISDGPVRD